MPGLPRDPGSGIVTKSQVPQVLGDLTRGNRFGFLGDSITVSDSAQNASLAEYHVHLALKSGGRIEWGKKAGVGGATTASVLSTHLPTILNNPIRPDRVIVLAGVNDCTGGTISGAVANLTAIYRQLRASGIEPVACTLTPRPGLTTPQRAIYDGICRFVARHAGENGYPLIDFESALTADDGTWLDPAWSGDNIHPSVASGSAKMGDVAWTTLQPYLVPSSAMLPVSNLDVAGLTNPLMLIDTNADGQPDGWSLNSSAGGTKALVDATTDAAGNWFEISKNTAGVVDYVSATITAAAGDRIRCGARMMVSGVVGTAQATVYASTNGATAGARLAASWNVNVVPGTLITEFICPAGTTGVKMQFNINPSAGGAITARLAQPLLINLTTAGIG